MLSIKVDPHTHTLASGHAHSTIEENARHAKEKGLTGIAMSDHYGPFFMPLQANGMPVYGPMMNMEALPKVIHDVRILASAEIDIIDKEGHLFSWDMHFPGMENGPSVLDRVLKTRDVGIASVHNYSGHLELTPEEGTVMYMNALKTPGIHIIAHPGRAGVPFDIDKVVLCAKEQGKMLEINNHSFDFDDKVNSLCRDIALACKKHGTSIVVSSDAHSAFDIGKFDEAIKMLEEIDFPEELVANATLERLLETIAKANEIGGFKQ
jgi:Histidinol phosphatase and related hydrolases of the PHP family